MKLKYNPLEKVNIVRPVYRIPYIINLVRNKRVFDIGCYDETALLKQDTQYWLHGEIIKVAEYVLGIDNSPELPLSGISISENSRIIKGDACDIDPGVLNQYNLDLIVAGEFIEHLPNTLDFFKNLKRDFSGKQLICSTPNAISLSNSLLGLFRRESTHKDHLQLYSYKILNTLCKKANFTKWEIIPYYASFAEIILKTRGIARFSAKCVEKTINFLELIFPFFSAGFILNIKKI